MSEHYADKSNVTVEQVKDAILAGNEKVINDVASLFSIGLKSAVEVMGK